MKAVLYRDGEMFARDTVRLVIWEETSNTRRYVMADGTWKYQTDETEVMDPPPGFVIPAAAVEALAVAIQEFQGHASHADTEARVLRQWLEVEQRRVDRVLERDR